MKWLVFILLCLSEVYSYAQAPVIVDLGKQGAGAEAFLDHTDVSFEADGKGQLIISGLRAGTHHLSIFKEGFSTVNLKVNSEADENHYQSTMAALSVDLETHTVESSSRNGAGMSRLKYIEMDGLYAAKKNEIILPDEMVASKATNNSRQVFAKVPGLNTQETDAGGLQLGIGARGLDPKRTSNFNTRQDGYDISADALGYPESYYTPAMEGVEKIELVRGAASLQYGTQFGGLLNFRMKEGPKDKKLEVVSRQTAGSYGFFGSFNSVGGSHNGWNYYGYYQHKEGASWRPNTAFNANNVYGKLSKQINENWTIGMSYTHFYYNTKQPGGLTDRQFETDPFQSNRNRNWFRVDWNVASITVSGKINEKLTLDSKSFILDGERAALGFLGSINRIDTGGYRDLILGQFLNYGNETRLIQRFNLRDIPGALLVGTRFYRGDTRNRQGKATGFAEPTYEFLNPDFLEGSDFDFPSENISAFSEMLIPISSCWFITPGLRYEHILTRSAGYYTNEGRHPLTNELLFSEQLERNSSKVRNLVLLGIGAVWRCREDVEIYSNISQNYRALNFSDIYVNNPNLYIDPNMVDESGYTIDLGSKGSLLMERLSFDASLFSMIYQDRIATSIVDPRRIEVLNDQNGQAATINYRTNISDALFLGFEMFAELDMSNRKDSAKGWRWSWFNSLAAVHAQYISDDLAIDGNRVENVPMLNYKTGISLTKGSFGANLQWTYISDQFTDATNAEFFPDATVGTIPTYQVVDLSVKYGWKRLTLEGNVNNLLDEIYFTRRATGYPGPGIIPAERRMLYLTLQVKI